MQTVSRVITLLALLLAHAVPAWAQHAGHGEMKKGARKPPAGLSLGVAFAPSGELWIAGLDVQSRLFVQASPDGGRRWGARRILDNQGDAVSADGENRPKIAFGPNGWVVVSYTKPLAKPYTGDIRMLRSADGGKTFSTPFTVHEDRQVITHRFESIRFDRSGQLHVLWVDKRDAEAERARSGGKRAADDGAAIYGRMSPDGGATWGADAKLADGSCECCRIGIVETPQAGLVAMWRHVFPGSIRDHAFAPLAALGKGQAPVRATYDEWVLGACPHHGPGLANAADGGFHAVWFGLRAGMAAARYGRLAPDGSPQGPIRLLPDEQAEHADVASAGRRVAVVWRAFDGKQTRVRAWVSQDDGANFVQRELFASPLDNDHPRLAMRGDEAHVIWRTEREVHVRKIDW